MSAGYSKKSITCVFVHGWAMNSAVWEACIADLPGWIDPIRVDLPGHGTMAAVSADNLEDYVQAIALVVQRPVIWVGWSLGGLAVLRLARFYPERIAGLFMVACNPCFVKQPGWDSAVDAEVFEQFSNSLQKDTAATVRKFLALQVRGTDTAMQTVRLLQQALRLRGLPSTQALDTGLKILASSDLRAEIPWLKFPVTWLLGGRDTLVPVDLAHELIKLQPDIKLQIEAEAGHAPFISHPQTFTRSLIKFAESLR